MASFDRASSAPTQNLRSAPADTQYSSCDEDAEGEPDESYTAELSFWSTELGDASGSTRQLLLLLKHRFPFVESCSALGGGMLERTAKHGDTPIELDLPCEADATAESSRYAPAELQPMAASTSVADKRSSGKKRRRSSPKRLTDYCTSNKASSTRHRRRTKLPESQTAASSSKVLQRTLDLRRQRTTVACDCVGQSWVRREWCIVAVYTPSGKFKLRKKDEVPRRSLAALLTPPRERRAGFFEDASQGRTGLAKSSHSRAPAGSR